MIEKEAQKGKRKILSHKQPKEKKHLLLLSYGCVWLLLVLHSEFENLFLLVGSIDVLQEENKQLSSELLIFMEKVEWLSSQLL